MPLWNWSRTPEKPLIDRVAELEGQVKLLRMEWNEVFDKIAAASARQRKRDRDALDADLKEKETPAPVRKFELRKRAGLV